MMSRVMFTKVKDTCGNFTSQRVSTLVQIIQKRFKSRSKDHWAEIKKKNTPKDKAMEHFDDFYKTVFGKTWPSIRLALLCPQKYCAVVNNFGDTADVVKDLKDLGCFDMKEQWICELKNINISSMEEQSDIQLPSVSTFDKQLNVLHPRKEVTEEYKETYSSGSSSVREDESTDLYVETNDRLSLSTDNTMTDMSSYKKFSINEDCDSKLETSDDVYDDSRIIESVVKMDSAGALFDFVPVTKIKGMEEFVEVSEHYEYYEAEKDVPINIETEGQLNFPEYLKVYAFERGNIASFPSPRAGSMGNLGYYLMDASSLLPVLALDLQPDDTVLDMCAAPGGKSLVMLQTLLPGKVVCNDSQETRISRIKNVFHQYFANLDVWKNRVYITEQNGSTIQERNVYDKVLVDVPCTTDRYSVNEDDNNIYKTTRIKERIKIPELQASLLSSALKAVKPGGTVVYSTCSLSPIQNDGVVYMALKSIWSETSITFLVRDLSSAFRPLSFMYRFYDRGLRYGQLVIPHLPNNFGPMYVCKIVRVT